MCRVMRGRFVAEVVENNDNLFANVLMKMHYKSTKMYGAQKKNPLLSGDKRVFCLERVMGIEPVN